MTRFRSLAANARAYASELERVNSLRRNRPGLRALARALVDEITAEQERRRRSRS